MSDKLTGVYIILALTLVSTLVYFQIATPNRLESRHLAMAAETGTQTAQERSHEENTSV